MIMKTKWSPSWLSSVQPRKQRKYRYNAPLHVRQGFVSSNLSPELRKRFSRRSMQIRKGDEVRVMRGGFRGKTGTVERVDLSKSRIYTEEFKVKKVDGSEVPRALEPSNLMITKLKLDDKRRQAILDRTGQAGKGRPEPGKTEPEKTKTPEKGPSEKGAETKPKPKKVPKTAKKERPKTKPAKAKSAGNTAKKERPKTKPDKAKSPGKSKNKPEKGG
jgi:large subunit ribosomal protein L24